MLRKSSNQNWSKKKINLLKSELLLVHVEGLNNTKHAMLSCIKVLINAFFKTESNEVLNSHKTGTFDN